jgi:hypothetical protein
MISLLWMYVVTDQHVRLRECSGHGWVEVWRGDELESVCFADDLHPERIPPAIDSASFDEEKRDLLQLAGLFE